MSVQIARDLGVVLGRKCLQLIIAEDTGEILVDSVGGISQVGSPSSSAQELNLDPEVVRER